MLLPVTAKFPNASMDAFGGGADQSLNFTSAGIDGTLVGKKLFDTMSKMPALSRSFHSVSLKVLPRSALLALNSGTARRTLSTPSPVPVRIQSCANAGATAMIAINAASTNCLKLGFRYRCVIKLPFNRPLFIVSIFCNRTRTRLIPYCPNNQGATDQKYQYAGWPGPRIDRAKVRRSTALPAHLQDVHRASHRIRCTRAVLGRCADRSRIAASFP